MADTNKVITILEVKDHLASVLDKNNKKFDQLTAASDRFDQSMDRMSNNSIKNIDNMDKKLAKYAGTFKLLGGLAVTAGAAIGTGLLKAGQRAKEFNDVFLELENLNLDKTQSQVNNLRNNVLRTSLQTGKAAEDISQGFYDVQSATGLYNDQAKQIVETNAKFSKAFKSDFNTTLQGSVKAMKNFNLEAQEIDKYFGSMVKTVQVGVVTYDQLAQVQTDYSGAANRAGQEIDSANKLFAAFTFNAKSTEEAATLTKNAFEDLSKTRTLDAFEKFGINVFDENNKMKQLPEIVSMLNDKFKDIANNDKKIAKVVEQFGGNEGLNALIGASIKHGDELIRTFEAFDNVEFNMDKALANANKNAATLEDQVRNKLDTIFIKIGDASLPTINKGLDYMDKSVIPSIIKQLPEMERGIASFGNFLSKSVSYGEKLYNIVRKTIDFNNDVIKYGLGFGFGMDFLENRKRERNLKQIAGSGSVVDQLGGFVGVDPIGENLINQLGFNTNNVTSYGNKIEKILANELPNLQRSAEILGTQGAVDNFITTLQEKGGKQADEVIRMINQNLPNVLRNESIRNGSFKPGPTVNPMDILRDNSSTKPTIDLDKLLDDTSNKIRSNLSGVSTGGNQVRNVTVNIQKMVGIENLVTTVVEQARGALEEAMRETLIKSIRDAEVGVSNAM